MLNHKVDGGFILLLGISLFLGHEWLVHEWRLPTDPESVCLRWASVTLIAAGALMEVSETIIERLTKDD